ncbi:glycosyl hydrolase family 28-related protein [Paenirhodobacter hankyongi]|uniref:Right-handed parallel beta-helix repeat-containing protein n=1 Tax=Paenirhodobacter hankyongi TaxID=2294033 RepID=A0A421BPZ3_9RHOB|nr:glycosyl hydrolase family 28-related protein [Sinirhodobacter hankyongi]RLL65007.1 right-handed parallel beta-helix repeat-containing protein [Sinirhodobacter hankyongi]
MNMAITDGLALMPPAFAEGLDAWSSENGTAGSASYDGAVNAALVPADADFGTCLELSKLLSVQKLRAMVHTPIVPGCYLRIRARVKAVAGNLPSVRIAGYAMSGSGHVAGLIETGPEVALPTYGTVVTVEAIVGTGSRGGVDMPWGLAPAYGHFGLDLTGLNGGVVRIEDLVIEDITEAFLRDMMDWVDVRDYGAAGDGVTNDKAAFEAADAAAAGRSILVPEGTYFIGGSVTLTAPIRFVGTVVTPTEARFALRGSFDFPTYAAAFGDEMTGFKKALQALFGYTDHNALDLCGRRIEVTEPIDVKALSPDISSFSNRRVLRNGQFNVVVGPAWDDTTVTSQATYSTATPLTLTNVGNIANIPVGARVSGAGVGREVYVRAVNVAAGSLTLSQPFFGGSGTHSYTFTRYKYVLDFSGLAKLDRFNIDDIEFLCNGKASCILLAPSGEMFQIRDSYVVKPKDRAITSIGHGCQDLLVDRCQFLSNEGAMAATERSSIALNVNANDSKIRESRFVRFRHTMVLNGSGHLIVGNHWFQGDDLDAAPRLPGLIFCQPNVQSAVTGNYIDNSTIEWTNEYSANPDFGAEYSFGGLTVSGNTFVSIDAAPWFTWFSVKPYGSGHFIQGLSVANNVFKAIDGVVTRIDGVDTTFAALDNSRMRNVVFEANTFNGVTQMTVNPVSVQVDQASAQAVWTVAAGAYLPFGGWARNVGALVAEGPITNAAGGRINGMPYVTVEQGATKQLVTLTWQEAVKGRVHIRLRMDNPN